MLRTSFSFSMSVLYVCLLPCFNGALAYQGRGFLSRGIGLSLGLVVDSFQLFICGWNFFFPLVGVLAAILHIFRYGVGSHVGMRLRVAFWLFNFALFFAVFF